MFHSLETVLLILKMGTHILLALVELWGSNLAFRESILVLGFYFQSPPTLYKTIPFDKAIFIATGNVFPFHWFCNINKQITLFPVLYKH